jgi:hypothetical protein
MRGLPGFMAAYSRRNIWVGVPKQATLAAVRQSPALEKIMAAKYEPIFASLLTATDKRDLDARLAEVLRQWKPTDPPNENLV